MAILNVAVNLGYRIKNGQIQVLFINRNKPPYQGYLALPGGKIEHGEPIRDALTRELLEETGMELTKVQLYSVVNELFFTGNGDLKGHFVLFYHISQFDDITQLQASDEGDLRWISAAELTKFEEDIVPSDHKIVEAFVRDLQNQDIDLRYFECTLRGQPLENDVKLEKLTIEKWQNMQLK